MFQQSIFQPNSNFLNLHPNTLLLSLICLSGDKAQSIFLSITIRLEQAAQFPLKLTEALCCYLTDLKRGVCWRKGCALQPSVSIQHAQPQVTLTEQAQHAAHAAVPQGHMGAHCGTQQASGLAQARACFAYVKACATTSPR